MDAFRKNVFTRKYGKSTELFTFPNTIYNLLEHPLVQDADVIHLHWVANFIDFSTFFRNTTKPVVWTFHDMNVLLGGFHYEKDRAINNQSWQLLDEQLHVRKVRALRKCSRLTVITPSTWLKKLVSSCLDFKNFRVHHIANGINTDIFKPVNKVVARQALGLPGHKRIVLFVADSVESPRKGFTLLEKALSLLKDEDVLLCTLGGLNSSLSDLRIHNMGFIYDEAVAARAYASADLFVIPSLEDNLPNTVLESMACGVPVVGFNIGGIPDMIIDGVTGLLVPPMNVEELAEKIELLLNNSDQRVEMGMKARQFIEENFSVDVQAKKHCELYQSLCE